MASVYENQLQQLLTNPGSFQGTPGFGFARDQGLQAASRSAAARGMRGSGNVLAELTKLGTGYAMQDYGSQVDRLGRLTGQDQANELGKGRLALDDRLGTGQLNLGRDRLGLDRQLGNDRLSLDRDLGFGGLNQRRREGDQSFGLGMYRAGNDYELGREGNANTAQNNWYNYSLGRDRNNLTEAGMENDFNNQQQQNGIGWYNARTNRGSAQSQNYWNSRDPRYRDPVKPPGTF